MKRILSLLCSIVAAISLSIPVLASSLDSEVSTATRFLQENGIMVGNQYGDLQLEKSLTRAELAVILSRMTVNQEYLMVDKAYFTKQCTFTDVPDWAKVYVGYCAAMHYVNGYGNGRYGSNDLVTPQAACTVLLRACGMLVPFEWTYDTALDAAVQYGIAPREALQEPHISRGNMAILLYRTAEKLGYFPMDESTIESPITTGSPLTRNADGSINVPSDGSQYIPKEGDVIRCDDGSNYTIQDARLYGNSMFAEGPLPPLPTPTCDWSQFPEITLPNTEVRRFQVNGRDYLFIRNLYEMRRMQYTLYNAIGSNPQTWQNGKLVLRSDGSPLARVSLTIPDDVHYSFFWPWRAEQLTNDFNSCPPGLYQLNVWDVFTDGIYQRTEYQVAVT